MTQHNDGERCPTCGNPSDLHVLVGTLEDTIDRRESEYDALADMNKRLNAEIRRYRHVLSELLNEPSPYTPEKGKG